MANPSAVDPSVSPFLIAKVVRNLLKKHHEPKIPMKAERLANRLDQMLAPFLSVPATKQQSQRIFVAAESLDMGEGAGDNDDEMDIDDADYSVADSTDSINSAVQANDYYTQWKIDLKEIFEEGLELRMAMELMGGRYEFAFPRSGSLLATVTRGHGRPRTDSDHKHEVMLGLLPEIKGKFRRVREGEMEEWVVMSKPRFVAFSS
jgi:hypothetical protein